MMTTQTQLHKQNKKSTSQRQTILVITSATTRTEQVSESKKQRTKDKKQRGKQQSLAENE